MVNAVLPTPPFWVLKAMNNVSFFISFIFKLLNILPLYSWAAKTLFWAWQFIVS